MEDRRLLASVLSGNRQPATGSDVRQDHRRRTPPTVSIACLTTQDRLTAEKASALEGIVFLGAAPRLAERLTAWGARCHAGDAAGLAAALADPGLRLLCRLPPDHLPIRPPAAIAATLEARPDNPGPRPDGAWCLSATAARRLVVESATRPDVDGLAALARAALPVSRTPISYLRPDGAPLGIADLPAAFGSGLPFAGPFDMARDPAAANRALAATEGGRRATRTPALPDGLAPIGTPPAPRPGEILAVFVVRDEALRLPSALRAARTLGVDRVIVIDNRSSDGTRAVAAQAGAHLIDAPGDYPASGFGIAWTNAVLDAWGHNHWALVLDADEELVFPGSDAVGLPALTRHLDSLGSEALRTILLDCFPAGPLSACACRPGQPLTEVAPLFEQPVLRRERIEGFPDSLDYGGVRERLFFPEADPTRGRRWLRQKLFNLGLRVPGLGSSDRFRRLAPPRSPTLTKLPLIRWREGAALLASTHRLAPMRLAPEQPSGVLLHFKFLQDFHARAVDAVTRGAHYDGSREYHRYLAKLEADPAFALAGPDSQRYQGPSQLVELGLMTDTPAWRATRQG